MEAVKPRSSRRSSHRTQWAAQFAVASELCKRGYEVALTMGNHPSVDIMVTSPDGVPFAVDVKGLYKPNFFVLRPKAPRTGLFYVLAYVPDGRPNRFFVLSQAEAGQAVSEHLERARRIAVAKGKAAAEADDLPGIPWTRAEPFAERWSTLPA